MRLELHVQMDSAAFADSLDPPFEISRILREYADRIDGYGTQFDVVTRLQDANGNRVGFAVVTESEPTA